MADLTEPHANVIAALAAVQSEIGGVSKLTPSQRGRSAEGGVNFPYRGIDEIAGAAQRLFGKHGIVIVPTVLSRETTEFKVKSGATWTDSIVLVRWDIFGPGGRDDKIEAVTEGWGRDNADKGINKAMTGAYKNLLLRILTIGDPSDDTDAHQEPEPPVAPEVIHDPETLALWERLRSIADTPLANEVREYAAREGMPLTRAVFDLDPSWRTCVEQFLDDAASIPLTEPTAT